MVEIGLMPSIIFRKTCLSKILLRKGLRVSVVLGLRNVTFPLCFAHFDLFETSCVYRTFISMGLLKCPRGIAVNRNGFAYGKF